MIVEPERRRVGALTGGARPWLLACALSTATTGLWAQASAAPTDARSWLARIQSASSTANFSGTFVVTAGGVASSSRIVHASDGRQTYELVDSLDGPRHLVLRHNDTVKTVWPEDRTVLVEKRQHDASFPFLLRVGGQRITDLYDVSKAGVERVAGLEAAVLVVRPKDNWRHGYRLWSDTQTGLLLRADVIGAAGEVLESAAFSQVSISQRPLTAQVQQALAGVQSYQVLKSGYSSTDLRSEGWALDPGVPGFQPVSCVRRPVMAANGGAAGPGTSDTTMLQAVYSDGLSSVSVFIEASGRDSSVVEGRTSSGALNTLTQRKDRWRVTVVGDLPPATLERFAAGLRRTAP